jgi:hypothetical protein
VVFFKEIRRPGQFVNVALDQPLHRRCRAYGEDRGVLLPKAPCSPSS